MRKSYKKRVERENENDRKSSCKNGVMSEYVRKILKRELQKRM